MPRIRPRPRALWGGIGAFVLGVELYTIYNESDGDTLSEVVRGLLPEGPVGDVIWTVGWGGFSYWFWRHILDEDSVWCLDKRR